MMTSDSRTINTRGEEFTESHGHGRSTGQWVTKRCRFRKGALLPNAVSAAENEIKEIPHPGNTDAKSARQKKNYC